MSSQFLTYFVGGTLAHFVLVYEISKIFALIPNPSNISLWTVYYYSKLKVT